MGTLVALLLLGVLFLFLFASIGAGIISMFFTTKTGRITSTMLVVAFGFVILFGVFV